MYQDVIKCFLKETCCFDLDLDELGSFCLEVFEPLFLTLQFYRWRCTKAHFLNSSEVIEKDEESSVNVSDRIFEFCPSY
jgi:hypothetical protein